MKGFTSAIVGPAAWARNVAGARSLLADGTAKLAGSSAGDVDLHLDAFADGVARCLHDVVRLADQAASGFDWGTVPPFPCPSP